MQFERGIQFVGLRHMLQERRVLTQRELALDIDHVDHRQVMPPADLKIVEVVRRRDLHRAGALLGVGVFVRDDRDGAADQRQDRVAADQVLVALVVRMHRDGGVAEHRLGPGRGNDNVFGPNAFDRILDVPQRALHLDLLHLQIGDGGEQLRVPVNEPLVLVDQVLPVELDEDLQHGLRQPLVHGEALARPVARGAEPLELVGDGAAGLGLPGPDLLEEFVAAHVAARDVALCRQYCARPPSASRCRRDRCRAARARRARASARSGTGCPATCC